uniref:J domain-containing protein n=1 Tax=Hyaloperonospora arabidopsidis (strain Emoy2) TaxID=559515 RepID=M4C5G4_HYAAE
MESTSRVSRTVKPQAKRVEESSPLKNRAWWWTDEAADSDTERAVASSETELLNAAVLCAALSATQSEPLDADGSTNDRALHELEMHVRKSLLPHSLQFPVLVFTPDYVLMQSELAVLCAVRATKPADVLQTVIGSAAPFSRPYVHRFGGARIHAPFWKRTQRLDLQDIHQKARQAKKMLLLCGHSIGGSIAQLAFCELVYLYLPTKTRLLLEKRDYDEQKREEQSMRTSEAVDFRLMLQGMEKEERVAISRSMPHVLAIGFGSPYIGSTDLSVILEALNLTKRVMTFVNEYDCIPGILNVAQSAAMVAKTTERFVTITKATKALANLLPVQMQQRFDNLAATNNTGIVPNASSAYLSMTLNILQSTFQKFREFNIMKEIDYQYCPCGTYVFLSKSGADYHIYSDPGAIRKALGKEEDSNTTLTGNAILQHLMSAYVDSVARRSKSVQINASMDFYARLGVPRNATEKQIRSAYKRLALKWHPDRWANSSANPQERASAEDIFKLLAESYEVLSDVEARQTYDAHLIDSPSFKEEFMRNGTVNGMTLDEAFATFQDVIDNLSGVVSKVTSRFSTSKSTVVNPLRMPPSGSSSLKPNNHDNIFAPDRIRVSRTVGIGADQHEQILYLEPEEIIAGDVAASNYVAGSSSAANTGLRTVSVVGGAVAVGASVALIVSAWSQYSEMSKKRRQAAAVRAMPAECLLLLLEDYHDTQHRDTTQLLLEQADNRERRKDGVSFAISGSSLASAALAKLKQEEDAAENELIEDFFDCASEYDSVALEAMAEEEFFDCVNLIDEVAIHFRDDTLKEDKYADIGPHEDSGAGIVSELVAFPCGSIVNTPFGLATVRDWRETELAAVVRFSCNEHMVGYIQKVNISRGALVAKEAASSSLQSKRTKLADRVIARYRLDNGEASSNLKKLVAASGDGALDSGIRAAGGVALANGMARTSSALGGAAAAPLTIASILVDIGKEYYDYRKRYADKKSLGGLSKTTEQLLMQDFRLKTGEVIASRTAGAAGAGIGAYGVASALGMWSTAGLAGPVGIVAATSAAVVGGMLGFFAGSKAYSASTARYFTSQQNAKEHIDRLELGARILFDEFDPEATGTISKEDCTKLMKKLYDAMDSVSESSYERTMTVVQEDAFEGPVTWGIFWEWVSTEAARALRELEHEESNQPEGVAGATWWNSYMTYFSYFNSKSAVPLLAEPRASVYPSVLAAFGLSVSSIKADGPRAGQSEEESLVLKAQIEFLVNNGHLTVMDAFQLREQLVCDDPVVREAARNTIAAMNKGLLDKASDQNLVCDGFGFTGGDAIDTFVDEPEQERDFTRAQTSNITASDQEKRRKHMPDERIDVMCSLMSTQGLQRFLQRQNILVSTANEAPVRHEDLHCLALMATDITLSTL